MNKSKLLLAAILIVGSLTSCLTNKNMSNIESLSSKKWHLISLYENGSKAFADTSLFNVSFINNKTISGIGACNRFFGSYKSDNKSIISIDMGGSTKMACPNMNIEQDFFLALDGVDNYKIKGKKLILYKGDTEVAALN